MPKRFSILKETIGCLNRMKKKLKPKNFIEKLMEISLQENKGKESTNGHLIRQSRDLGMESKDN